MRRGTTARGRTRRRGSWAARRRRWAGPGVGSPPRAWGGRHGHWRSGGRTRFTPTCVRRTRATASTGPAATVHPHVRGEDMTEVTRYSRACGSPPRAWGGQAIRGRARRPDRFTPTCVGRTAEPYLDVRAATTKNRKAATIRLREDLVAGLVAMRPEGVKASVRVFTVPHNDTRRSHFRAAGIVEVDEMGMRADFHSLRHAFATNVRIADASAEEARLLMRHEDVRQTAGYTHLPATRTREVLDRLPSLGLRSPAVSDCGVGTPGGTLEIVRGSLDVSGAVVGRGLSGNENRPGLPGDCLVLSGSDWVCQGTTKSSVGRTRTYNQPVNSRLLYH